MNRELIDIDISSIVMKSRVREFDGDLSSLERSIRKVGLLHPVIIDRNNVLISGGRRIEACRHAGITKLPALKFDITCDSMAALDVQADENLCRKPLTAEELEMQIQMKKNFLTGRPQKGVKGIFAKLKKMFTGR